MTASTLRVAIVGCGKIADGHVEEIGKLPDLATVAACCDLEPLIAEQLAERHRIPRRYHRFDELLERERPDVVHVCTPPAAHVPLALAALDAGCHVYVEKPLAPDAAGARRVIARAEAARRKLTIGWTSHFDPPALALRALVADGALGEPVHAESFLGYSLDGTYGAAVLGDATHWVHRIPGRLWHNNIDHLLYRVLEFVDDEAPRVTALAQVRRATRFADARDAMPDELRVLLAGARATGSCVFSSHARPAGHTLHVRGTRNTALVDHVARTLTLDASPTLPSAIGRIVPAFDQAWRYFKEGARNAAAFARADYHFFAGLNELLRRFYRSILDDAPPPVPYRDLLRVAAITDEIVRQTEARP